MELALILILLVVAELVVSVWMLARHKDYLRRVKVLENRVDGLAKDTLVSGERLADRPEDVASLVQRATPEDIAQAQQILAALGLGGDGGHGEQ